MLFRILVYLSEDEWQSLRNLADQEMRGMREQARYLLSKELTRLDSAMQPDQPYDETVLKSGTASES